MFSQGANYTTAFMESEIENNNNKTKQNKNTFVHC